MSPTPPHLRALEEKEREGIPGLVEVLREEGLEAVQHVLWDATGWQRDYSPPAWRNQPTEEQKRIGWEMAVRIEKILCTALHEAHERQIEKTMDTLAEGRRGSTGATWTETRGDGSPPAWPALADRHAPSRSFPDHAGRLKPKY